MSLALHVRLRLTSVCSLLGVQALFGLGESNLGEWQFRIPDSGIPEDCWRGSLPAFPWSLVSLD